MCKSPLTISSELIHDHARALLLGEFLLIREPESAFYNEFILIPPPPPPLPEAARGSSVLPVSLSSIWRQTTWLSHDLSFLGSCSLFPQPFLTWHRFPWTIPHFTPGCGQVFQGPTSKWVPGTEHISRSQGVFSQWPPPLPQNSEPPPPNQAS